jgi:hypothetical protein
MIFFKMFVGQLVFMWFFVFVIQFRKEVVPIFGAFEMEVAKM